MRELLFDLMPVDHWKHFIHAPALLMEDLTAGVAPMAGGGYGSREQVGRPFSGRRLLGTEKCTEPTLRS